jgi:Leucine-rich repeat (LRR) protein
LRVTLIALLFDFLFCWANLNAEQELKEPNVGFWFPSSIANSPQSKAAINEKDLWEEDFANWLMNPKPYGGKDTLLQIKEARTNQTEELNLGYDSYISDLSPIAELTHLTALSLTNNSKFNSPIITIHGTIRDEVHEVQNAVRDLSPLTKLVNLKLLSLNDHNISDISPLANLTNLEYLSLVFLKKILLIKKLLSRT